MAPTALARLPKRSKTGYVARIQGHQVYIQHGQYVPPSHAGHGHIERTPAESSTGLKQAHTGKLSGKERTGGLFQAKKALYTLAGFQHLSRFKVPSSYIKALGHLGHGSYRQKGSGPGIWSQYMILGFIMRGPNLIPT